MDAYHNSHFTIKNKYTWVCCFMYSSIPWSCESFLAALYPSSRQPVYQKEWI